VGPAGDARRSHPPPRPSEGVILKPPGHRPTGRIAHFGDLGQEKLTDEQMAKLGEVDVAMFQLANSFSAMSAENRLGFSQMNQVKPRLLIPTHFDSAAAEIATQEWKATWATGPLTISRDDLPAETTCLFMGMQATGYGALYSLPPFEG
jgi:L-ascorbate metabolism protein UlaG (beta-lactamase superfamily)